MTVADIPLGLRLARQAGWNQVEADWQRFLAMQPDGCFVGELDGAAVATTAAFIFGPIAWIAMVLVDVDSRRRGVATTLLKHALDFLDARGVQTIRLDATAAGQPVYEELGFVPEYGLTRYTGTAALSDGGFAPAGDKPQLDDVIALDRWATATPRAKLLTRLLAESPDLTRVLRREGRLEGYITGRRGANATQIGPCIATAQAGPVLLTEALSYCAGRPVFIDVPHDHAAARQIVETRGLTAQRHFLRMCRGTRIRDRVGAIWASSGPEKG